MMKYFTLEGWLADQNLDADPMPSRRAVEAYRGYLDSVRGGLPSALQQLLSSVSLHDARLREMTVDVLKQSATLRFDAADITMREARKVVLEYEPLRLLKSTGDPQLGLAGPHGYGDVGNDEIEVLQDGLFEHRLVFSTGIQLLLRFGGVHFEAEEG